MPRPGHRARSRVSSAARIPRRAPADGDPSADSRRPRAHASHRDRAGVGAVLPPERLSRLREVSFPLDKTGPILLLFGFTNSLTPPSLHLAPGRQLTPPVPKRPGSPESRSASVFHTLPTSFRFGAGSDGSARTQSGSPLCDRLRHACAATERSPPWSRDGEAAPDASAIARIMPSRPRQPASRHPVVRGSSYPQIPTPLAHCPRPGGRALPPATKRRSRPPQRRTMARNASSATRAIRSAAAAEHAKPRYAEARSAVA
jgi:hypothetical protein